MNRNARHRAAIAAAAIIMFSGCAAPPGDAGQYLASSEVQPPTRAIRMGVPEVYMTGIVRKGAFDVLDLVDLTKGGTTPGVPVALDKPIRTSLAVRFDVRHKVSRSVTHDYTVLFAPEHPGTDTAEARFTTDTSTRGVGLHLSSGWGVFIGRFPTSRTDWVYTSTNGTQLAVRTVKADAQADPQFHVFNLEPAASAKKIKVYLKPPPHGTPDCDLTAKCRTEVKNTATPTVLNTGATPAGDPFVKKARKWAQGAKMNLLP
jgi:hypothetical protein